MWTVRSESGRLRAVIVQESIEGFWERKLPFVGIESSSHYLARCPHADIDGGREQWAQLPSFLREEGVQVFEVSSILEKALEGATVEERRRMVDGVWEGMPSAPDAEVSSGTSSRGTHPSRITTGRPTGWCSPTFSVWGGRTPGTPRSPPRWARSSVT